MIRGAAFRWLLARKQYSRALSYYLPPTYGPGRAAVCSSQAVHACYQLGLHKTVINSVVKDRHRRGTFARVVSLAACGHDTEAALLARKLAAQRGFGPFLPALAEALAPFAPELALELLKGIDADKGLKAALLLRLGRDDEAVSVLRQAIKVGQTSRSGELGLLLSNAMPAPPVRQLEYMNAFLAPHGLPPLALIDEERAPGPMNLRPAAEHAPVHGPLISILMTVFNAGQRIVPAISSLLAQTYRDIEVIVVDDASTDDTRQVVQALAAADARVVYIGLPRNVGTYVAKTIGLRRANGEFVTCHDSDDWSHPLRLERHARPLMENPAIVFTTSNWVRIQDDGLYYARPVYPLMRFNPASPMFRRDLVLRQAGGWDPVRTGADSEFAARLTLVFGQRARHRVTQPLAFGAHRPGSLMTAAATGYSASGMSPTRLDYWESWGHHHIAELRAGRRPFVSPDLLAERRFAAPPEIIVPREDIEICLESIG